MRKIVTYVTVWGALSGCVHQTATPAITLLPPAIMRPSPIMRPPPAPASNEEKEPAPPGPAAQVQEAAPQALSLQVLAGNIEPLQGEDPVLPDQVLSASRGQVLKGSYKMCISSSGKVKSVTPVVGIDGADPGIVAALAAWRFPKLPLTICKVQTLRFEVP